MAHVFLSGFMGTGKSTVGPLVAARLGREFLDLDAVIEARVGAPVTEIFAREGEAGFRRHERAAVEALMGRPAAVIALGGGAVVDSQVRARLRTAGVLVSLTANAATIERRLAGDTARPLLADGLSESVRALLARRTAAYADADVLVATDRCTPEEVARVVVERLAL